MAGKLTVNPQIVDSEYVLFLGAGASAPLGFLPTAPFLEHLQAQLPQLINERQGNSPTSQAFGALFNEAARHFGVLRPDAELVLDYVDYLIIASGQLGRLPPEFSQLAGTGSTSELHSQWVAMLEGVQSGIQQVMADHYSSTVDNEKALKLYTPLISILQSDNRITPVYTTNYDWTFENLTAGPSPFALIDGFEQDPLGPRWSRDVFDTFAQDEKAKTIVLFKMHGSTLWRRDPSDSRLIRKSSPGGTRPVLIYPTRDKPEALEDEPFKTAYDYFQGALHVQICVL